MRYYTRKYRDPNIFGAGIVVKTDRKWNTLVAVEQAECQLRYRTLEGQVASGRSGLSSDALKCPDLTRGRVELDVGPAGSKGSMPPEHWGHDSRDLG